MSHQERALRTAALRTWVDARGGVAHSSDIHAAGYSPHDIAGAVEVGALSRIRRSWLATPEAGHPRRKAATVSGRLTCVTRAASLELWLPDLDEKQRLPHIAVPHSRSRIATTDMNLHWATGPSAVGRTELLDPILNVLFHIARCLPRIDALAVWESAIRKGHADHTILARTRWRSSRAAELAAVASALSDSGLETVFVDGMRRIGVRLRQQVAIGGHAVDALIGDRLIVQIDGFAHHRAANRRRDIRHDAQLVLHGYTVLRFDYQQILFDWQHVESTVLIAMAQGLHLAR